MEGEHLMFSLRVVGADWPAGALNPYVSMSERKQKTGSEILRVSLAVDRVVEGATGCCFSVRIAITGQP